MLIQPATVADLAQIVSVHRAAFPRHFMTQLGGAFLKRYYRLTLEYPSGVLLCAASPPEGIVGFVAGFLDPPGFYAALRKNRWRLAAAMLGAVLRHPGLLRRALHNRQRVAKSAETPSDQRAVAELASVGVDPRHQGEGAGRRLVEAFVARAAELGARRVILRTDSDDNDRVHRFYARLGFSCEPDPDSLPERPMTRYTRLL